jgi:hypothetical protein
VKDIQVAMRVEVARARKSAPATRKPPAITIGPKWVVARFDGRQACFLCWAKRGYWASTDEPERAFRFETRTEAQAACDRVGGFEAGIVDSPGGWAPRQMTLKATFE